MARVYNVYQNDVKIADGISAKSYKATGLTPETAYTFKVTAVEDGVESVGVTTTATTEASDIPVSSITPSQKTMAIKVGGEPRAVAFEVAPPNATDPSFTVVSENEAVATYVDGKVNPIGEGVTDIIATANDSSKQAGSIRVTVSADLVES